MRRCFKKKYQYLYFLWLGFSVCVLNNVAYAGVCSAISVAELLDEKNPIEMVLNTTTCSTTKSLTSLSEAPNTVSVYTAKDIAHLGARTVSDVLQIVAGMQVQMKSNNREKVWIRGVPSEFNNKVTLYVDDVPYRNVFGGFPIDEELPIETIKKIEVIRGAGSALYGANAFSGVINLYTYQPEERGENLVKTAVGERDTALGFFSLGHEFKQIAKVMLEGKWITTDGRKPLINREGLDSQRTGDQKLGYLRFKATALEDKLSISATYSQFNNERVDKSQAKNSREYENLRLSVAYQEQLTAGLAFESLAYYTRTARVEVEHSYDAPLNDATKNLVEAFEFLDEVEQIGFNALTTVDTFESNTLTLGFEYKRERLVASEFSNLETGEKSTFVQNKHYDNLALNAYSVFLQDRQGFFNNSLYLNAGIRFDKLDLFSDQFSYRAGLTYAFNEHYYTKLLYATAYRAPSFIEFTRAPVGTTLPNVETINTMEVQLGYQSKKVQANLTFYYNQYDDFIFRKNSFHENTQNLSAGVFANVDNLKIIGLEFESKAILTENWESFLNLAWTNARSEQQKQLMPLQTTTTLTAGIEYHQRLGQGEIRFHNHIIAYGERKDWDSSLWNVGQQQRYSNRNNDLNGAFVVWNTGLHYNWDLGGNQRLQFDLTVHNLLDEIHYTQPLTPPRSDRIANFDTQYQGRHTRFSVSYAW